MSTLTYLLITLAKVYAGLFLLRFLLQFLRADFHNPLSQVIERTTAPLAGPLRRIFKPLYLGGRGCDVASLLMMLLVFTALFVGLFILSDTAINPLTLLLAVLANSVMLFLGLYQLLIFAEIIMSWLGQQGQTNPAAPLLWTLTNPLLAPARRLIPSIGGLDFSPMLVLFILFLMRMFMRDIFRGLIV